MEKGNVMSDAKHKFTCPEHGEVEPTKLGYSYPLTGWCPECGEMLEDENAEASERAAQGPFAGTDGCREGSE